MNRSYEIIKLKLEDAHQPVRYFTPEFYETYLQYRKNTGDGAATPHPYESVRNTDFFLKTPAAFSAFVKIYRDRLPKYCIDFYDNPSNHKILKRMVDRFEDKESAGKYARQWAQFYGKYYEISKVA